MAYRNSTISTNSYPLDESEYSNKKPDYATLLATLGMKLTQKDDERAYLEK